MVVHALQQVACKLCVKKRHGQPQQLDEEVAHERYVHAHAYVQQQPAAYKVECRAAQRQHELSQEHEPHESDVAALYSHVDNGLCEERKHELQHAA